MNRYFTEVIDAHVAIADWLGKGAGELQPLLARFHADFSMIALNGQPATLRYSTVVFTQSADGLRWLHLHETPIGQ